jgi:hypothetical protein
MSGLSDPRKKNLPIPFSASGWCFFRTATGMEIELLSHETGDKHERIFPSHVA